MPLKSGGFLEERFFRELSSLPLPSAAVVIDVRDELDGEGRAMPLIGYLAIALEDLAAEMKLNQVPRWRHLADCIELLRVETTPLRMGDVEFLRAEANPLEILQDDSVDFTLVTQIGKKIAIQGRDSLTQTIGRAYIDLVRNQHISAMKDNGSDEQELSSSTVDPERPTVRVFFLTDMEDKESLIRASKYAQWLKEWMDEQHGSRMYSRDNCISTVAICMNAPVKGQLDILQALGEPTELPSPLNALMPCTALDMVILMQSYRDDAAYIGGEAQIYQAELIMYTLLLHWPEILTGTGWKTRDDLDGRQVLPWPIYTIGISALEHSARWGARWLDYGLTTRVLELMRDAKKVDQEAMILRAGVQQWTAEWWQAVQNTVPNVLFGAVPAIQGLGRLQSLANSSPFRSGSLRRTRGELVRFSNEVGELYAPVGSVTLQHTIDSTPFLLEQVRQKGNSTGTVQSRMQQTYTQLTDLHTRAERFTAERFQGAWGAIPRALNQLAALRESIDEIRRIQQSVPNIAAMRNQFEYEVADADKLIASKMRTWKLPLVGEVLQSTGMSLILVFLLAIVLWFGLDHASFIPEILRQPFLPSISWLTWLTGLHVLCLMFVGAVATTYLLLHNRTLRREQQSIYHKLRATLRNHAAEVSAFVAANAALTLLEWTDLYTPGKERSPYEERLLQLDNVLETAQKAARKQQQLADKRLRFGLDQGLVRNAPEPLWPNLSNRKDLLTWRRIKDAYLSANGKLTANFQPLNLLSEMLVRRLGTETSGNILQSLTGGRTLSTQDDGQRFQTLCTMLIGILLSSDIASPAIQDVLPLIDRYVQDQHSFLPESSVLHSDVLNLNEVLRETMLAQALYGDEVIPSFTLKLDTRKEFALAAWIKQQNLFDLALTESLEENGVIAHVLMRKTSLQQAVEDLRNKSRLTGYPDQMTGDDHFYLLLAPGPVSEAFITSQERTHLEPTLFPDAEKIVYLQIHRIRQLLPGTSLVLKQ